METLYEYNRRKYQQLKGMGNTMYNGIACPNCGSELQDADNTVLLSDPPQRRVKCLVCEFQGTRWA